MSGDKAGEGRQGRAGAGDGHAGAEGPATCGSRAVDQLVTAAYGDLRRLAVKLLRRERAGHTLQATALIHEIYLRLVKEEEMAWQGKTHFFRVAAMAMARYLKEYARRRASKKRGGGALRIPLAAGLAADRPRDQEGVDLTDLLDRLGELGDRVARVGEMKVLLGLTHDEIAECLAVSSRTVERDWRYARAMLISWLKGE